MVSHEHVTPDMRQCIQECSGCHATCLEMIGHCLHLGGPHADPHHVRLLQDCAQICQTSADFMLRGSDLHGHVCRGCAEVCRKCAGDCERLAGDDAPMKACAQTCHRCAASCQTMAA